MQTMEFLVLLLSLDETYLTRGPYSFKFDSEIKLEFASNEQCGLFLTEALTTAA